MTLVASFLAKVEGGVSREFQGYYKEKCQACFKQIALNKFLGCFMLFRCFKDVLSKFSRVLKAVEKDV